MATHDELVVRVRDAHALSRMLQDDAIEPAAAETLIDLFAEASVIADDALPRDRVAIGSHVTYLELPNGPARAVAIVLPGQAHVAAGRISVLSPVGLGLLGRAPGTDVRVRIPGGLELPLRLVASAPAALEETA